MILYSLRRPKTASKPGSQDRYILKSITLIRKIARFLNRAYNRRFPNKITDDDSLQIPTDQASSTNALP